MSERRSAPRVVEEHAGRRTYVVDARRAALKVVSAHIARRQALPGRAHFGVDGGEVVVLDVDRHQHVAVRSDVARHLPYQLVAAHIEVLELDPQRHAGGETPDEAVVPNDEDTDFTQLLT